MAVLLMKKIFCVVIALFLCGCSAGKTSLEKSKTAAKTAEFSYSDELIDLEFMKLYDISKIENMLYFDLRVTDKSDGNICISLTDAAIDGISVTAESGSLFLISSGKKALNTFSVNTSTTALPDKFHIKQISFKIIVLNADMNVIKTSDTVKIELQNGSTAVSAQKLRGKR